VKTRRKNEVIRVVSGTPKHPLWQTVSEKWRVDPHTYVIEYTGGGNPATFIGVYATSDAAQRVANLMKAHDKVLDHVLKYATGTTDITEHVSLSAENRVQLNHPVGKPKERVRLVIDKQQIKIETPEQQGYMSSVLKSKPTAYKHKHAILSTGNLETYIDSETAEVDQQHG